MVTGPTQGHGSITRKPGLTGKVTRTAPEPAAGQAASASAVSATGRNTPAAAAFKFTGTLSELGDPGPVPGLRQAPTRIGRLGDRMVTRTEHEPEF